jgi:hypothetical protein
MFETKFLHPGDVENREISNEHKWQEHGHRTYVYYANVYTYVRAYDYAYVNAYNFEYDYTDV